MMTVLIISYRKTPRAIEGASKYFVVQAVARRFLLMGIVSHFLVSGGFFVFWSYDFLRYCLMLRGLFIKMAVLPRPFWFVDVVRGVRLSQGFYVVVRSKIVPIYLFVSLRKENIMMGFCLVGLFSVFLGSVLGVNQIRIRKIIAYSSIAHMGWMVSCFSSLSRWYCLSLFLCYCLMLLPLFIVGAVCSLEYVFKYKKTQYFSRVRVLVVFRLLSLGGLPPLVGFFYKWVMFFGLVKEGFLLVSGILVVLSLVSLYYYIGVCYNVFSVYWFVPKIFSGLKFLSTKMYMFLSLNLSVVLIVGLLRFLGPLTRVRLM